MARTLYVVRQCHQIFGIRIIRCKSRERLSPRQNNPIFGNKPPGSELNLGYSDSQRDAHRLVFEFPGSFAPHFLLQKTCSPSPRLNLKKKKVRVTFTAFCITKCSPQIATEKKTRVRRAGVSQYRTSQYTMPNYFPRCGNGRKHYLLPPGRK